MKLLKNWKTATAFLIAFAFIFTLGTGFAEWTFETLGGANVEGKVIESKNDPIDEVYENYFFDENKVYTLYFFPQPATSATNPGYVNNAFSYTPNKNDNWGYWDLTKGDVDDKNNGKYGYKKLVVNLSPTSEQLKEIGNPLTTLRDENHYPLRFTGWSADQQNSINFTKDQVTINVNVGGLTRPKTISKLPFTNLFNNDYKYADLTKSLQDLDGGTDGTLKTTDGTPAKDHIIFLYPVFTSGKNYATVNSGYGSQDQPIVRLQSLNDVVDKQYSDISYPEKAYYFDQKWGTNAGPYNNLPENGPFNYRDSYFSYTGLRVEQGDRFYLTMDIPGRSTTTGKYYWIGKWRTLSWENAQVNNDTNIEATPKYFTNAITDTEKSSGQDNNPRNLFIDAKDPADIRTYRTATETFLKPGPGTYNIYIYINWNQEGKTTPAATPNTVKEFNDTLSPTSTVFLKTSRYVRVFKKNQAGVFGKIDGLENYAATIFVKVQKVEEPRLLNWENSNNFTDLEGGIRMFPLGEKIGAGTNNSLVQSLNTHSGLTRAIDYYAFNVPVKGNGSKHYVGEQTGTENDVWFNDRYMAFTTQSAPVNDTSNYIASPFAGHYFETPTTQDTSQINAYPIVGKKKDFEVPAGPKFGGNTAMENERYVKFSQPNIKTLTKTNGDIINNNDVYSTEISTSFPKKYNYRNFFSPTTLTPTNQAYYDDSVFHFVLRLYYAYDQNGGGFNASYVYGYTVFAVPRKIRKFNALYFINSADVKNFVRKNGLIDMPKTLENLKATYYTTELLSKYNDKGETTEIPANSLLLYANGTSAAGSVDQLIRQGKIGKPRDYWDETNAYDENSMFSFDKVKIILFDAA